ncbi:MULTISPECIES: ComF family protein [Aquitalea]|uniref:ComF family protein n=1 Tax=Aquitalea TaxID=407217 RepID=UPI000696CC70|nr:MULTISPECIES: ComF family protein [Aquitalea]QBJ77800.1 ComF family protein [Aquitalea sp. USM4]
MLSNIKRKFIDNCSIFNQHCLLCNRRNCPDGLCNGCKASLPALPSMHCPICAEPALTGDICGFCLRRPPAFDAIHTPYLFGYPLNAIIYAVKYGKRLEMTGALAALMAEFARKQAVSSDLVIPVPLSKERLAERGFNQSIPLAQAIAATMQSRFSTTLCWRKRNTVPQASLGRAERSRNVRHAFGVKQRIDGLSVAIVDDVATSGATLSALAEILKKQGAKRVDAWVLCRASFPKT